MFRGLIQIYKLWGCGGVEQHAARFVHNNPITLGAPYNQLGRLRRTWVATKPQPDPAQPALGCAPREVASLWTTLSLGAALVISFPGLIYSYPGRDTATFNTPAESGNRVEIVPIEYRKRFNKWKATFLSAGTGRSLWLKYADSPTFHLTITVAKSEGRGARVAGYQWKDGKLVAATIILGHQLDRGYPSSYYYPVLSALALFQDAADTSSSDILAAAKIAHEFGHINLAANTDPATFQLQNELSPVYVSHFMSNGRSVEDPQLIELAIRMGGTPEVLMAQRELGAETWALRYLLERLATNRRRKLLKLVRKSLEGNPALYSLQPGTEPDALTSKQTSGIDAQPALLDQFVVGCQRFGVERDLSRIRGLIRIQLLLEVIQDLCSAVQPLDRIRLLVRATPARSQRPCTRAPSISIRFVSVPDSH